LGWEKRRFNRVAVDLAADLSPVDIEMRVLEPVVVYRARVVDLCPSGMLAFGPRHFKAGMRFRVDLRLPDRTIELFVVVRHSFAKDGDFIPVFGHGMQIVAGTEEAIVALVKYLTGLKAFASVALTEASHTRPAA